MRISGMSLGESPAVARRRVRLALRRAREARGLTQTDVAQALDWSLSKVQRIEGGEVSVSSTDLRAALAYLEITEPETVGHLMDDARTSRRQRWFTDARYREFLTPGTQQLLQFESEAAAIRSFTLTLVPGLLQTGDYARVTLDLAGPGLPEELAKARHEVRMQRRSQVFGRPDPPDYRVILDESVLWRELGRVRVVAEQLESLLEMTRQPNIRVRVIPFSAGPLALLGPFTIFELDPEGDDAVLYREGYDTDEVVQDRTEVDHHRAIFEDLWNRSLTEPASGRLIAARAATMLASLDRLDHHPAG